jgi:hypothetical protein
MAFADLRLALMTFAQRWDGASLSATLLVLPSGDPSQPLLPGTPAFGGQALKLRAGLIGSLDALPSLAAASYVPLARPAPVHAKELFALLGTKFAPQNTVGVQQPGAASDRIRKALPATYTALLPPGAQAGANVGSLDDFGCTLRGQKPAPLKTTPRSTSWGEVISHALRNPYLADALGLRYEFTLGGDDAKTLATNGGWLFAALDPSDAYFSVWDASLHDAVKAYATRIPPLAAGSPRQVFTAVLFPVANPKGTQPQANEAEFDQAIVEAEIYDDGFAELVHARQPDSLDAHVGDGKTVTNAASDAGIQIGWDDEQVLKWHNRQLAINAALQAGQEPAFEAPLGVLGYRVDVRVPVAGEPPSKRNQGWQSLMQAGGKVPPALQGKIAAFSGELTVEPTSTSPANQRDFWLPLYFAQWRGMPLGTQDLAPHLLAGGTAAKNPGAIAPQPSNFSGSAPPIALLYGTTYEFRTRLSDLTGGGPLPSDDPLSEASAERAAVTFSRWVPPKGLRLDPLFDGMHVTPHVDRLQVTRPTIGYPEALFTWRYGTDPNVAATTKNALLKQLGLAPDGTPPPAPPPKNTVVATGVPDPDVVQLEITVEVRALAHDLAADTSADGIFQPIYTTTRDIPPLDPLPANPAEPDVARDTAIAPLALQYVDVDDVATLLAPASGALPIPRSRDVRILITPLAAGPTGSTHYFGAFPSGSTRTPVTRGNTSHVLVRAPAESESSPLFAPLPSARPSLQALFFEPHTDGDPVAALLRDLATQLDLDFSGLTLQARPGERVIFGATGFKNTIAADGGSITFASATEIFRNWTVALQWELARDWTWDGLGDGVAHVSLVPAAPATETEIGRIVVPRVASAQALAGAIDRTKTRLVFLHAIDPSVADPRDGFADRDPYRLTALVTSETAAPLTLRSDELELRLPVAVNPAGVPQLASAGYALSPYQPVDDYSATLSRHRRLWLEITEPPAKGDRLFARLLAYAPDPLLYSDPSLQAAPPGEPPALALDPEFIRSITPHQPSDTDGLEAMVELSASADDPLKFLLPLPDGVAEVDPRLFGMWTYELRFGHKDPWSLAHARYGRPLRVAGVLHPAPELPCAAAWQRLIPIDVPPLGGGVAVKTNWKIVVSAPYATPVLADGRRVGSGTPFTTIGFLLYAQAIQADGSGYRNVLLAHQGATPVDPRKTQRGAIEFDYGRAEFAQSSIAQTLAEEGLPADAPLSVVAVEFYPPGGTVVQGPLGLVPGIPAAAVQAFDPFDSASFGKRRILRTSPLTKVEPYC